MASQDNYKGKGEKTARKKEGNRFATKKSKFCLMH